jgi:hypothetical protein
LVKSSSSIRALSISLTSIVFAKHKHPHAIAVDCYNYIIEMVSKHAKSV